MLKSKTSRFVLGVLMAVGMLTGSLFPPAQSQSTPLATRGYPTALLSAPIFRKANALRDSYRYQEAVVELQRIADGNTGTEIEATARTVRASTLHLLAGFLDKAHAAEWEAQSRQEYQTIVQRFPNSKYWLDATISLGGSPQATEALMRQLGGPSFEDIRNGRVTRIREDIFPIQYRDMVADIYYLPLKDSSVAEKIRFLTFVVVSFPTSGTQFPNHDLRELFLAPGNEDVAVTPTIEVKKPKNAADVTTTGSTLRAELSGGDVHASPIDQKASRVQLDGQDILSACQLTYKIDPRGPVFERLGVRYVPPAPLTPGMHQYRIYTETAGYLRAAERVVNFKVRAGNSGQEDDSDSEDDDEGTR